ncbi:hypothetical protein [Pseudovibrio sp. Alg231-02]|uniref:hypothetical protein n=1 Tax=Pseudovibrio sp. Alg231-02 TaxID=1922223 RepID=UPI000D54E17A|nr:hypothetical protein [Pseudovibrio sp. Alg231-02]
MRWKYFSNLMFVFVFALSCTTTAKQSHAGWSYALVAVATATSFISSHSGGKASRAKAKARAKEFEALMASVHSIDVKIDASLLLLKDIKASILTIPDETLSRIRLAATKDTVEVAVEYANVIAAKELYASKAVEHTKSKLGFALYDLNRDTGYLAQRVVAGDIHAMTYLALVQEAVLNTHFALIYSNDTISKEEAEEIKTTPNRGECIEKELLKPEFAKYYTCPKITTSIGAEHFRLLSDQLRRFNRVWASAIDVKEGPLYGSASKLADSFSYHVDFGGRRDERLRDHRLEYAELEYSYTQATQEDGPDTIPDNWGSPDAFIDYIDRPKPNTYVNRSGEWPNWQKLFPEVNPIPSLYEKGRHLQAIASLFFNLPMAAFEENRDLCLILIPLAHTPPKLEWTMNQVDQEGNQDEHFIFHHRLVPMGAVVHRAVGDVTVVKEEGAAIFKGKLQRIIGTSRYTDFDLYNWTSKNAASYRDMFLEDPMRFCEPTDRVFISSEYVGRFGRWIGAIRGQEGDYAAPLRLSNYNQEASTRLARFADTSRATVLRQAFSYRVSTHNQLNALLQLDPKDTSKDYTEVAKSTSALLAYAAATEAFLSNQLWLSTFPRK